MRCLKNRKFVGTVKLIPNLSDKKNYIIRYRSVKFYFQLGLNVTAVHKALQKYINFKTHKRKKVKQSFERDFSNCLITMFIRKQWRIFKMLYFAMLIKEKKNY